tara:strand:+ start:15768 stop:16907 length:1140 start_codon:yes stop_codon:yes gene_type:complete
MRVDLIGTFYNNHSLSIVNRYIAFELAKYTELYITPLDFFDPESKLEVEVLEQLEELKNKDLEDPDIQIRHSYPPIWRHPLSDKTKVVFIQPWEFSKVPLEWVLKWEHFADAIICPSSWNRDRYLDAGINPDKSFCVPNGYNPDIFNFEGRKKTEEGKLTFTFVGCAQYRKGIDILLNAWASSLVRADNAKLIIKDMPSIYGENNLLFEIIKMQYKSGCAEVEYIDDKLSEKEMANIYKQTDILVHPFRGEGFGMHIQEAMACGALPLISRGGAPEQFLNDDNALLVEVKQELINILDGKVMAAKPGDSFSGMGQHAYINEPIQEDLANKIKGVYHSHIRESLLEKAKEADLYTWEKVGSMYFEALEEIHSREKVQRVG